MTDPTYTAFRERRERLAALVARQRAVARELEDTALTDALDKLESRVRADGFTVMISGEFKLGKSTLINALLGAEVLPAFAYPTTAIISHVRYGEQRRAVLHSLPAGDNGAPPPREIPIEDLDKYVVIDANHPDSPNPYERAEVLWPLELCRDGVDIVDSPGLNEDPVREKVTLGFLQRADAVVLVLDITRPVSMNERRFLLNTLLPLGHEDIFFVYNKINLIPASQLEQTLQIGRQRLMRVAEDEPDVKVRDDRLFFINARGALDLRLAGRGEVASDSSGVPEFERTLARFLVDDRGRVKLLAPARQLRHGFATCRQHILERERMYEIELSELVARYEAEEPRLHALESRQARLTERLLRGIDGLVREVEVEAHQFLGGVATRCPAWARESKPTSRVTINPLNTQQQVNAVAEEVVGILSDRIQAEFRAWQGSHLRSLVEERVKALEAELEEDLKDVLRQIDEVKVTITGDGQELRVDAGQGSPMERVLAGAAGIMLLDPGLGYTGFKFGAVSMLKAAMPQLVLAAVGLTFGLGPIALLALLGGFSLFQNWTRMDKMNERIKEMVGTELSARLERTAGDRARQLAGELGDHLRRLGDEISSGLHNEIASVREQVEAGIRDKREGEARVASRREALQSLGTELEAIEHARGELVEEVAGIV